jgi:hypothetical protein
MLPQTFIFPPYEEGYFDDQAIPVDRKVMAKQGRAAKYFAHQLVGNSTEVSKTTISWVTERSQLITLLGLRKRLKWRQ